MSQPRSPPPLPHLTGELAHLGKKPAGLEYLPAQLLSQLPTERAPLWLADTAIVRDEVQGMSAEPQQGIQAAVAGAPGGKENSPIRRWHWGGVVPEF